MAYEFLSFFFFFWWILEMDLNFFLCSLSLFSCYNQKQRKSESHFPPTFGVYFFQLTFPSSCFSFVCNFVQSLFRHHSIQQIQGDYGITQPVQIPAGHLLVCKHRQVPSPTCRQALHWCLETGASPSYDFCKG